MFPAGGITETDRKEFNRQMDAEFRYVRDFIILHYHVTERTDSEFWRRCRDMDIPESLQHRLDLFRDTGLVFEAESDIFRENSWVQVMLGQGIEPRSYHPIVDMMDEAELRQFMQFQRQKVDHVLKQLPTHQEFIDRYCPGSPGLESATYCGDQPGCDPNRAFRRSATKASTWSLSADESSPTTSRRSEGRCAAGSPSVWNAK